MHCCSCLVCTPLCFLPRAFARFGVPSWLAPLFCTPCASLTGLLAALLLAGFLPVLYASLDGWLAALLFPVSRGGLASFVRGFAVSPSCRFLPVLYGAGVYVGGLRWLRTPLSAVSCLFCTLRASLAALLFGGVLPVLYASCFSVLFAGGACLFCTGDGSRGGLASFVPYPFSSGGLPVLYALGLGLSLPRWGVLPLLYACLLYRVVFWLLSSTVFASFVRLSSFWPCLGGLSSAGPCLFCTLVALLTSHPSFLWGSWPVSRGSSLARGGGALGPRFLRFGGGLLGCSTPFSPLLCAARVSFLLSWSFGSPLRLLFLLCSFFLLSVRSAGGSFPFLFRIFPWGGSASFFFLACLRPLRFLLYSIAPVAINMLTVNTNHPKLNGKYDFHNSAINWSYLILG